VIGNLVVFKDSDRIVEPADYFRICRYFLVPAAKRAAVVNVPRAATIGAKRIPHGVKLRTKPISGTSARLRPILNANRSSESISFPLGKSNWIRLKPGR